jgi:hypothetical protein
MSFSAAQRNLWRARFFLGLAEKEQRQQQLRFEEFAAYLSAFLACARYFTAMLEQCKSKERPEWSLWWSKFRQKLAQDDRAFLNFMTKQRDLEQHEEGAETQRDVTYVSIHQIDFDTPRHPFDGHAIILGPPGTPPVKVGRMVHTWERGGATHDVLEDCRCYLGMLEKAVTEFEAAHPTDSIA